MFNYTKEQRDKWLLIHMVIWSFIIILVFNYLTPMMSDDFSYASQVREANNLWDLVVQEYNQYMTWIGRSVAHIILRIFLFLPPVVFKVANSLCYIALSLLIYVSCRTRKSCDPLLYMLIQIGLWLFTVDFRQTILWETGACNYLWTTTIILGFMTLCRHAFNLMCREGKTGPMRMRLGVAAVLFVLGLIAGWCSENTSGACLVYLFILLGVGIRYFHRMMVPIMAAIIGNMVGLMAMVLAPGNALRSAQREELHSGLFGLVSRFQKVSLTIRSYFFVLIALFILLWIAIWILDTRAQYKEKWQLLARPGMYAFLFVITCYALIATSSTQPRAFFGAGIFLLIAVLQEARILVDISRILNVRGPRILVYSAAAILGTYLGFVILDCGAKVARIQRDVNERVSYIEAAREAGLDEVTVAQIHVDFYNDYSAMEENELSEDPAYWTNVSYEEYYGVSKIIALPYDEWAVKMGLETQEEADATAKVLEEDTDEVINHLPGWK